MNLSARGVPVRPGVQDLRGPQQEARVQGRADCISLISRLLSISHKIAKKPTFAFDFWLGCFVFGKVFAQFFKKIQTGLGVMDGVWCSVMEFFLSQFQPSKKIFQSILTPISPISFFLFPVCYDRVHRPFRVHAPPPAAGGIRVLPGRLARRGRVGLPAGLCVKCSCSSF